MATDEYAKLFKRAWGDRDYTALNAEQQNLYQKLISQPDVSLAGVVTLAPVRWARQTSGQTVESIEATLAELEEARFVVVDRSTQEVLVRSYIRRDLGWRSPKTMKGIVGAVERILSPRLRAAVSAELERIDTSGLPTRVSEVTGKSNRQAIEGMLRNLIADTPPEGVSDTPCHTPPEGVSDTPCHTPPEGVSLTRAATATANATAIANATANATATPVVTSDSKPKSVTRASQPVDNPPSRSEPVTGLGLGDEIR
ncbi:MAG: hypothetical protein E7A55_14850 [Clostridium perfringens]|nr:hypothetical protein [Clostridium perfringens]